MTDELDFSTLGSGATVVVGCILLGLALGATGSGSAPSKPAGRFTAADLDAKLSDITVEEQIRVGKACTKAVIRANEATRRQSPFYTVAADEDMPDYCNCIVGRASGELSRFQFLALEAGFNAFAERTNVMFPGAFNVRLSSPELTSLGRDAMKLGLSHAEVQDKYNEVEATTNRIARYCMGFVPTPTKRPWR
jgi:hypothetical protein